MQESDNSLPFEKRGERFPDTRRERKPFYPLLLSLVVAFGLVGLIFGAYEVIERIWLAHLEAETLSMLHRIRGIFTALLVGLAVSWIVVRSSPALLTVSSLDETTETPEEVREARVRLYAQWFIAMRWVAVLVTGVLIFIAVPVLELLPPESLWPLVATVGALAFANIAYRIGLRLSARGRPLLIAQAYTDLVLLTLLLHFSGGVVNPLAVFMVFHVLIGGILLSRTECFRIAAAGSLLFALLALAEWRGFLPHYPLSLHPAGGGGDSAILAARHAPYVLSGIAIHAAILLVAAYFVTTLSERLRRSQRRLSGLAERALADRRVLEQSLETTSTGIRLLSTDLVPLWANDRWKAWFGEITDACAIFPDDPLAGCPARDCLTAGRIDISEISPPGESNRGKVYQITSAPLHDGRGDVSRVVQLAQDITEQKDAHRRMMRAGQMAAVGELAGQVAHEVNNPIAIISAKANLLLANRREEMSPKVAEELGKMVDLANRVARIAQGLLSYSRPSPTTRSPIDLCPAVRKSLAMIEHKARNQNIEIQDKLPAEPVSAIANAAEIEQVFLNLFINAIQAMPDGGRVAVSLLPSGNGRNGGQIVFAVDDTGSGVPEELRERVFEPFFTTKQEGRGTGLGLSICQGLVRSHGGAIAIQSAPGGGARFVVTLPVDPDPAKPAKGSAE